MKLLPAYFSKNSLLSILFFMVLYVFIDWVSYSDFLGIVLVFGIIALYLLFAKEKLFVYYITILLLLSDDFPKLENSTVNSLAGYAIGGKTIFAYILFIVLLKIIIERLCKKNKVLRLNIYDQILVAISFLYLFSALIGIPNLVNYPSEYVSQINPIIAIITSYMLIKKNIYLKKDLLEFFKIIIFVFTGRVLLTMILLIFSGDIVVYLPNSSSINQLIIIVLYFWIGVWLLGSKNKALICKISSVLPVLLVLGYLFILSGRYIMLLFAVSIFLALVLLLPTIKKLFKLIVSITIILAGVIVFGLFFMPQKSEYVFWKYSTILDWELNPSSGSETVAVREIEIINILGKLIENKSLLWGEGLGSYFESKYYSFSENVYKDNANAYSREQLENDKFFKPHNSLIQILLQMGVLGLFCYLFFIIVLFINMKKDFFRSNDFELKILFFSLFLGSFLIFTLNTTLTINYFYGLIIALLANGHFLINKPANKIMAI